jgi:hypothetical protein
MQNFVALVFLSVFLLVPAHADDNSLWDDIEDDDRPGQHGRDNAAEKQRNNPGKGSKGADDDSLWDEINDEVDDDGKMYKKNKNGKK